MKKHPAGKARNSGAAMPQRLPYVLTVAQRQARVQEKREGRVGYIGIDLVEDDVPSDFEMESAPEPVILRSVPDLVLRLCREMMDDDRILRVDTGRHARIQGVWPRLLRCQADLAMLGSVVEAANSSDGDLLYPISVWAISSQNEAELISLIDVFRDDPANSSVLADIYNRNVVRASLFASSLSISVPPLLLERAEVWVRRASTGLILPVVWQE